MSDPAASSGSRSAPKREAGAYARYRESVAYAEGLANVSFRKNHGKAKRDPSFFLDRTRYFLKLLGDPQRGFRYIHVTGTAGKGTVSAMLQNILTDAGEKAGLFTSPYAMTAIEEIKVGELYIPPARFSAIIDAMKPSIAAAARGPYGAPSAFDIFFATALVYFKEEGCRWAVLEVGLGGRYDSTNVIERPVATVITSIDYDHTEILGKTLWEIAADKAGIIKKGSRFFTSEQRPALRRIFERECARMGATFHFVGRDARYMARNELLARAVSSGLGLPASAIESGIARTRLPCRFEVVQKEPLVILDGAHNRAKVASAMANLEQLRYARLLVVAGISSLKKDTRAVMRPLASKADRIILTSFGSGERMGAHPKALLPLALRYKKRQARASIVESPEEALRTALAEAGPDDCVLVVGSFFLAGSLRRRWYPEDRVLKDRKSF